MMGKRHICPCGSRITHTLCLMCFFTCPSYSQCVPHMHRYRFDGNEWSCKGSITVGPDQRKATFTGLTPDRKFCVELIPFKQNKYRRVVEGQAIRSKGVVIGDKLPPGWITVRRSGDSSHYYYNKITEEKSDTKPDDTSIYYVPNDIAKKFTKYERDSYLHCFKGFDKDKTGALDVTEMKDVVDDLGLTITNRRLMKIMKEIDADGSGKIEFAECTYYGRSLFLQYASFTVFAQRRSYHTHPPYRTPKIKSPDTCHFFARASRCAVPHLRCGFPVS